MGPIRNALPPLGAARRGEGRGPIITLDRAARLDWARVWAQWPDTRPNLERKFASQPEESFPSGMLQTEIVARGAMKRYGPGGRDAVRRIWTSVHGTLLLNPTIAWSATDKVFVLRGSSEARPDPIAPVALAHVLAAYAAEFHDWYPQFAGSQNGEHLAVRLARNNPFAIIPELDRRLVHGVETHAPQDVQPNLRTASDVGMDEAYFADARTVDVLVTSGLASCIAVLLHDAVAERGLVAHVSSESDPASLAAILKRIPRGRYAAALIGGDGHAESSQTFLSLKQVLARARIPIVETHLGQRGAVPRPATIGLVLASGERVAVPRSQEHAIQYKKPKRPGDWPPDGVLRFCDLREGVVKVR